MKYHTSFWWNVIKFNRDTSAHMILYLIEILIINFNNNKLKCWSIIFINFHVLRPPEYEYRIKVHDYVYTRMSSHCCLDGFWDCAALCWWHGNYDIHARVPWELIKKLELRVTWTRVEHQLTLHIHTTFLNLRWFIKMCCGRKWELHSLRKNRVIIEASNNAIFVSC